MEITPAVSSKKPRAKQSGAVPAATPRAKRATLTKPPAAPAEGELAQMIATAAYYLAAERGFAPGGELDDWLTAERHIMARRG